MSMSNLDSGGRQWATVISMNINGAVVHMYYVNFLYLISKCLRVIGRNHVT